MLKRNGKTSNTTVAFWLVLAEVLILTPLTWYYAVPLERAAIISGLAGITGLIGVPVAAVGTLYQLSKWQDRKEANGK